MSADGSYYSDTQGYTHAGDYVHDNEPLREGETRRYIYHEHGSTANLRPYLRNQQYTADGGINDVWDGGDKDVFNADAINFVDVHLSDDGTQLTIDVNGTQEWSTTEPGNHSQVYFSSYEWAGSTGTSSLILMSIFTQGPPKAQTNPPTRSGSNLEGEITDVMAGPPATTYFEYREQGTSEWTRTADPQDRISADGSFWREEAGYDHAGDYVHFNQPLEEGKTHRFTYHERGSTANFEPQLRNQEYTADDNINNFWAGNDQDVLPTDSPFNVDVWLSPAGDEVTVEVDGTQYWSTTKPSNHEQVYFSSYEYGGATASDPTQQNMRYQLQDAIGMNDNKSFREIFVPPTLDTTYEYRAVGHRASGEDTGSIQSFSTNRPSVQTNPVQSTGMETAALEADVTAMGSADTVDVYFQYRQQGNSTWQETKGAPHGLYVRADGDFWTDPEGFAHNGDYVHDNRAFEPGESRTYQYLEAGSGAQLYGTLRNTTKAIADGRSNVKNIPELTEREEIMSNIPDQFELRVEYAADGSEFRFYVDGSLEATWTGLGDHHELYFSSCEYAGGTGSSSLRVLRPLVNSPGTKSRTISGLKLDTEYEYRAIARGYGRDTGSIQTFFTRAPEPPDIMTDAANNLQLESATLNGTLSGLGDADTVGVSFQYRQQGSSTWKRTDDPSGQILPEGDRWTNPDGYGHAGGYVHDNEPFSPGESRHYTYYEAGSGADFEPNLRNQVATDSTTIPSIWEGSNEDVLPDNERFNVIVEYSADGNSVTISLWSNPLTDPQHTWTADVSGEGDVYFSSYEYAGENSISSNSMRLLSIRPSRSSTGSFSETVDLSPGTDYEYRAVGEGYGIDTGNIVTFSTPTPTPPTVQTETADDTGFHSARLAGSLPDMGTSDTTDVFFQYRQQGAASWTTAYEYPRSELIAADGSYWENPDGYAHDNDFVHDNEPISPGETRRYIYHEAGSGADFEPNLRNQTDVADGDITGGLEGIWEGTYQDILPANERFEVVVEYSGDGSQVTITLNHGTASDPQHTWTTDVSSYGDVYFSSYEYSGTSGENSLRLLRPSILGTGSFNELIDGLSLTTNYEYRAIARHEYGRDTGSIVPFYTMGMPAITNPTSGDQFGDETVNVQWNADGTPNGFDLEFSPDGGNSWSTLESNISGSSRSTNWQPTTNTLDGELRLTAEDFVGDSYNDTSGPFVVDLQDPAITLNDPTGGEFIEGNTTYTINWFAPDAGGSGYDSFKIEYSPDSGATWTDVATGIGGSNTSYNWSTPGTATQEGLIRVTATDNVGNTASDTSSVFSVWLTDNQDPQVNVTYPTAGEFLGDGNQYQITWDASSPGPSGYDSFDVEFSPDGGGTWSNLGTGLPADDRSYSWTVNEAQTQQARIRVTAHDNAGNNNPDMTGDFTIDATSPSVNITSPTGGETYQGGEEITVEWEATDGSLSGYDSFDVEYSGDGGSSWSTVKSGLDASTRSYNWQVKAENTNQARLRIVAHSNADLTGTSASNDFTIQVDGVYLEFDKIPDFIQGGENYSVTWTGVNADNYNLYYYDNSDGSYNQLAYSTTTESHLWNVPNENTEGAQLRLQGMSSTETNDNIASKIFTIDADTPNVTLDAPSSSSVLAGGEEYTIQWTASDNGPAGMDHYELRYSLDGGNTWSNVITDDKGGHARQHVWKVPNVNTTDAAVQIRAYDKAGNMSQDDSINSPTFTIDSVEPAVYVTKTLTEASYQTGEDVRMSWVTKEPGLSGYEEFTIDFSSNGGDTWYTITDAFDTGKNEFNHSFALPNVQTTEAQVRLTSRDRAGNKKTYATDPFEITGSTNTGVELKADELNRMRGDTISLSIQTGLSEDYFDTVSFGVDEKVFDTQTTSPYETTLSTADMAGSSHPIKVDLHDRFGDTYTDTAALFLTDFVAQDTNIVISQGDSVGFSLPVKFNDNLEPNFGLKNPHELAGTVDTGPGLPKVNYFTPTDVSGTETLIYSVSTGTQTDTNEILLDVREPANLSINSFSITTLDTPLVSSNEMTFSLRTSIINNGSAPAELLGKNDIFSVVTAEGRELNFEVNRAPPQKRIQVGGDSSVIINWNLTLPADETRFGISDIVLSSDTDLTYYDQITEDTVTGLTINTSSILLQKKFSLFSKISEIQQFGDRGIDTSTINIVPDGISLEAGFENVSNEHATANDTPWLDLKAGAKGDLLVSTERMDIADTESFDTTLNQRAHPKYSFAGKSPDVFRKSIREATKQLKSKKDVSAIPNSLVQISYWLDEPGSSDTYVSDSLNESVKLTLNDVSLKNPEAAVLTKLNTGKENWITADTGPVIQSAGDSTYHVTFTISPEVGFSVFQIFDAGGSVTTGGTADELVVYPNPFIPYDGNPKTGEYGSSPGQGIHFGAGETSGGNIKGFPAGTRVKLYTINGELIDEIKTNSGGIIQWNGRTRNGAPVGSGTYFYILDVPDGGQDTGKFSIVR